jgi:hypothetical protein
MDVEQWRKLVCSAHITGKLPLHALHHEVTLVADFIVKVKDAQLEFAPLGCPHPEDAVGVNALYAFVQIKVLPVVPDGIPICREFVL